MSDRKTGRGGGGGRGEEGKGGRRGKGGGGRKGRGGRKGEGGERGEEGERGRGEEGREKENDVEVMSTKILIPMKGIPVDWSGDCEGILRSCNRVCVPAV